MISETSRAGQLDGALEQLAGRSGSSASTSSASLVRRWGSRPRRSPAAGRSSGPRPADRPAISIAATPSDGRAGQPHGAARRRPERDRASARRRPGRPRPASDVAQRADDRSDDRPAPPRWPAAVATRRRRHAEQRGQEQPGEDRERLGGARSRSSRWAIVVGPLGSPRASQTLLQPAPRIGRRAPWSGRPTTRCSDQDRQAQDQHPRPGSVRPRARSRSRVVRPDVGRPGRTCWSDPRRPGSRPRGAASRRRSVVEIVVAAEVEQSVDHVERQLGRGIGADRRGGRRGHLGRDDQLAGQRRLVRARRAGS